MPHNTSYDNISPGISRSEKSLLNSHSLEARLTSPRNRVRDSISLRDMMGEVKSGSSRDLGRSPIATSMKSLESPVASADHKLHNILQAQELRQSWRSSVSKSLDKASPMIDPSSRKSINGLPAELEKITLPLNDVKDSPEGAEKVGRRRRRRSPGVLRKRGTSLEHRMRMLEKLNHQEESEKKSSLLSSFSPKSPGSMKRVSSANALKDRLRQRVRGANYCDLNGSSHSDSEPEEWTVEVKGATSFDDEDLTDDESNEIKKSRKKGKSRSKSRHRSRSKSTKKVSRKDPEDEEKEDPLNKSRSKSKGRTRSKSKGKAKRRSSKVDGTKTEDDANISTITSRRTRRLQKKNIVEDPTVASEGTHTTSEMDLSFKSIGNPKEISNSSAENYNISPGSFRGKKHTKAKKQPVDKSDNNEPSLSGFLKESDRLTVLSADRDNLSHVTEEKSIESFDPPPQFLQFDPTSESNHHIRSVDQNQAKKTSEIMSGLYGTLKLEIAEPVGLPTFEKLDTSVTTGTTEECSSNNSSNDDSHDFLEMIQMNPKKGLFPRSSSMVDPSTVNLKLVESRGQNAQWNFGEVNTPRSTRKKLGSIGKNMLFTKKGERLDKPMRRSSDFGARTGSLGNLVGLKARLKQSRAYDDSHVLLKCDDYF